MTRPNLFKWATSESSQDAFICWLLSWADPIHQHANEPLHKTGTAFLDNLFEIGNQQKPEAYRSIRIERQEAKIDVFVIVNNAIAIIIEDKTKTKDHSNQLQRYKDYVTAQYPQLKLLPIYLKTGDQWDETGITKAGYHFFRRSDFLAVLDEGAKLGVKNDVFSDFRAHLHIIDDAVVNYKSVPITNWNQDNWIGFFRELQVQLKGKWKYVPNKSGGFMGFRWHRNADKLLHLEQEKLCFKLDVEEKTLRKKKWKEWHRCVMDASKSQPLKLKKTRRRGRWMTVARVEGDYRQPNEQGMLDFERTMQVLRQAEALMDDAIARR